MELAACFGPGRLLGQLSGLGLGWVGRGGHGWLVLPFCWLGPMLGADVHGSAEAPRVVGVEQVREPGHAPLQVGRGIARPGRIGWQVLVMLARAAECLPGHYTVRASR